MENPATRVERSRKRLVAIASVVWIGAIAAFLAWEWIEAGSTARRFAEAHARSASNKDLVFRKWASLQGAIYVPPTDDTPPNPYLAGIPDRDVVTTTGKRLTLMHPVYMMRQLHELSRKEEGARGHITSLRPIRPENAPDAWEIKALRAFETGATEFVSIETMDDGPYLRLMRPFKVDAGCLPCHAAQGYKEGDIRGGISVSVPYGPYLSMIGKERLRRLLAHLLIGVLGLAGLWAGNVSLRRAVQEMRESEELFRSQFEQHSAVKLVIDPATGGIVDANQAAAVFYGWPLERLRRMKVDEINMLPPEKLMETMDKILSGERVRFEFRHRRADGSVRDVEVYSTKIRTRGKDLLHSIIHDVTDRKRAEEEVVRAAQEWQRTFDSTNDAIWILDRDHHVVRSNKTAQRFFPSLPDGFIGMRCYEIVHGTDKPFDECPVPRSRATLRRESMELASGDRWLEIIVDPILDSEGRYDGSVHIITDITDRKRGEEERKRLQLERMQADKMESIGRLAGGVAHDFNNMLMVILAHSDIAIGKVGPAESVYGDIVEIRKAAERSADLTRQMLAFARKQAVVPKVLDLNATVEGMLAMLRRLMGEEIEVAWLPQAGLWPVKVDPGQIDQILANLCANARDAIAGVGKVTIRTGNASFDEAACAIHRDAVPGVYVMLAVGDDGSGIDKETIANVFEPFFTTKEVGRGTGLGLATVYGIVKQNDGFIDVDSEPGRGTTFRIYLPRYAGEAPKAGTESPGEIPHGHGETVLLVEDELAILDMGRSMLESLGYTVLASGVPAEAISLVEAHAGKIDLLMTDVVMPGMNGKELADRLAAIRPGLKCLFMSGYTADVIANRGVLDAGVEFIQKPFLMKDLGSKLREVLERG
ncbi:MAG: PAS domain S-box protein [bacterium]